MPLKQTHRMPPGFADALVFITSTFNLRSPSTRSRNRRPRLRRPIKISAPIPLESMQLDLNATVSSNIPRPGENVAFIYKSGYLSSLSC